MGELHNMFGELCVQNPDGTYSNIGPVVSIEFSGECREEHPDYIDINLSIELTETQKRLLRRLIKNRRKQRIRQCVRWVKKYDCGGVLYD